MKLLDWLHHKFRNNSIEPFKDLIIGNPCICLSAQPSIDEQDCYMKPSFGSTYKSRSLKQPKQECEKSFSDSEAKREEENLEEETSTVISELFHGFLTIGTLGLEPIMSEPATPTFSMPLESINESKTEVTENDLKLINYELEKFLEAENREWCDESSGRNSHASTITLSGKPTDVAENEDYEKILVCPLQGYLFGSSIELPETRKEIKKEKASLAELFHRTKITNEENIEKSERGEIQGKKTHKSAMHLMKKMLKKLHASSRSPIPSAGGDAADSVSTKKILHKVIRVFHKKIHPESSIAAREFVNSHKYKVKKAPSGGYNNGDQMNLGEDNDGLTLEPMSKMGIQCCKTNLNAPRDGLPDSNLSAKEHWIMTDADYLVLEL
ncbi:protein LAZY 1 isoform X2 [Fagus crenata]